MAYLPGTPGDDQIIGAFANDTLLGFEGNDTLSGGDYYIFARYNLYFGGGNDSIDGGKGDDLLYGGKSFENDNPYRNALDNDTLLGGKGADTLYGEQDNDSLIGGNGDDVIYGGGDNDLVDIAQTYFVIDGSDLLCGDAGNDRLMGGFGNDTLEGGMGNDTLDGGAGDDLLTGNKGVDQFLYQTGGTFLTANIGIDRITDFKAGTDKIVLSRTTFTAFSSATGSFLASSEFESVADDVAATLSNAFITYSLDTGKLFYNQNGANSGLGDGAQFATLQGLPTLSAADFVIIT